MSIKILIPLLITCLLVFSNGIKKEDYSGVTVKKCGLTKGGKCQHKHVFACHQSNCTMNFYRMNATQGEIPWAVLIIDLSTKYIPTCSGSILNKNWVMTAAHCVYMKKMHLLKVLLGSSPNLTIDPFYDIKQIKIHKLYGKSAFMRNTYDIALLELSQPIVFGSDVCAVCLPPVMCEHKDKETALFAGYGRYDVRWMLQMGWVSFNSSHIYDNPFDYKQTNSSRLLSKFGPGLGNKTKPIGMFICLWRTLPDSGYFTCAGDSGGPLAQFDREGRAVQIGICQGHNWKVCSPCVGGVPTQRDIDNFDMAMIFTRVAIFIEWIVEQITDGKFVRKDEL